MPASIHICLVFASSGEQLGGLEQQVIVQANALSACSGVHVSVMGAPAYRDHFTSAVNFCSLPLHLSRNHPSLLIKLYRHLKALQPDIVHSHGHKAASLLSKLRRFTSYYRWVATAHGTKKQNHMLRHAHHVFAVSQGVQAAMAPLDSEVLYNAVPPYHEEQQNKAELCAEWQLDPELPLLIAVGRLAKVKAYARLMQAVRELEVNLLIFGDGPERDYLALRQSDRIRLAGHDHRVRRRYYAADCLVICSEREGHSLSMIEALQADCPVLSTPVSGATEWLPQSCLIQASSDDELTACLREKLPQLAALKAELSPYFERAREELSPEKLADKLLNTYHAVLASRPE
ncbi:MAG: glycosyltransferase [Oleiphilaceae bacterium]|nr:glycosyltransferase [Oleiphilaceae bacterium]